MRISIDSTEPLEDVIRVVGAMYDVTLMVATTDDAAVTVPARTSAGPDGSRTAKGKASRGRGTRRGRAGTRAQSGSRIAAASNEAVRSWARENGLTVSDHGRIPAVVLTAYREAQGS